MKNAFDVLAKNWIKCTNSGGYIAEFGGNINYAVIPPNLLSVGETYICKFSGSVFKGTIMKSSNLGDFYFGEIQWLSTKKRNLSKADAQTQEGCAAKNENSSGSYSSNTGAIVVMSTVNKNPEAYYCKIT